MLGGTTLRLESVSHRQGITKDVVGYIVVLLWLNGNLLLCDVLVQYCRFKSKISTVPGWVATCDNTILIGCSLEGAAEVYRKYTVKYTETY